MEFTGSLAEIEQLMRERKLMPKCIIMQSVIDPAEVVVLAWTKEKVTEHTYADTGMLDVLGLAMLKVGRIIEKFEHKGYLMLYFNNPGADHRYSHVNVGAYISGCETCWQAAITKAFMTNEELFRMFEKSVTSATLLKIKKGER